MMVAGAAARPSHSLGLAWLDRPLELVLCMTRQRFPRLIVRKRCLVLAAPVYASSTGWEASLLAPCRSPFAMPTGRQTRSGSPEMSGAVRCVRRQARGRPAPPARRARRWCRRSRRRPARRGWRWRGTSCAARACWGSTAALARPSSRSCPAARFGGAATASTSACSGGRRGPARWCRARVSLPYPCCAVVGRLRLLPAPALAAGAALRAGVGLGFTYPTPAASCGRLRPGGGERCLSRAGWQQCAATRARKQSLGVR
jgi:hypothetical protein